MADWKLVSACLTVAAILARLAVAMWRKNRPRTPLRLEVKISYERGVSHGDSYPMAIRPGAIRQNLGNGAPRRGMSRKSNPKSPESRTGKTPMEVGGRGQNRPAAPETSERKVDEAALRDETAPAQR